MTRTPSNTQRAKVLGNHLAENAADCRRNNVLVRVDEINTAQSVAFCSVEQLHHGFLRRNVPVARLLWKAEQALAPLTGLGIVPMISVRHKSLLNQSKPPARKMSPSLMDWIRDLWERLGSPWSREGFSVLPVTHDPFGWRKAMHGSGGR